MALTIEQWNALTEEERLSRAEEMPQELKDKSSQTTENIKKLQDEVAKLTEQLETVQRKNAGLYHDLRGERELRQELEDKAKQLELANTGGDEDTYLTTSKAKKLLDDHGKEVGKKVDELRSEFSKERLLLDEQRMMEKDARNELPIPYKEAIKVFAELCKTNPMYYRQYVDAANEPGGKPCELAYKTVLREHPDFVDRIKEQTREETLTNLDKKGHKKLPAGAAGTGKKDLNEMSITDIMKMDEKEWEKAARGKE